MRSLVIIFIDLIWQEEHAVALQESLAKSFIECMSIHGHRDAVHDVPSYHSVEKQIVLALGDNIKLAIMVAICGDRHIAQMLPDKSPRHFWIASVALELSDK